MGLAGLGITGIATAEEEKVTAKSVGLAEEIVQLEREGEHEAARKLAKEHDINMVVNDDFTDRSEDGEVGTDGRYSESSSEIYMSLINTEDDYWMATGVMELQDRVTRIRDASIVDDACGITYDSTEWTSRDATEDNLWISASSESSGESIEMEEYQPNVGVACAVDLPWTLSNPTTVNVQTELTRNDGTGNDDIPVYFEYEHTRAYVDSGPIDLSIGVEAKGLDVSYSFSDASKAWDDKISAEPGEHVGPE
ncbi:hypothetical protein C446_17569 [Halobiforma nitratireducens JCM 10879]|uniref:Uncharacterized protein n=1 Tax=Halobiforma nitratireducens JCM 10879 TaxID=1227454 RepID=M0L4N1_9EURY|nr:hypothetical protein C446_17569 [Halobiforma nitratireducens JCM 10879]